MKKSVRHSTKTSLILAIILLMGGCQPAENEQKAVRESPTGKPLSPAMERALDMWPTWDDRENPFFTNFKYSRITGIGKSDRVSRRDASKVIRHKDKYYVWYTRRETELPPAGIDNGTEKIPALDWDLAEIWCATSKAGFHWEELGPAVKPAPKGQYGDRSVSTTDILIYKGKYYLYYQTFTGPFSSKEGDHCDVSMAWADSPQGPWTKTSEPVLPLGGENDWDGGAIHDPYPLVYKGKIWLFYKGEVPRSGKVNWLVRAQGLAIADSPEGPFVKHEMNPIINSGHETCVFPWGEGLVALATVDGPEKNTVQYAPDGISFRPVANIVVPPYAPGPHCPDIFEDNGEGMGIKWGISHISEVEPVDTYRRMRTSNSFLIRFDCDLHRTDHDPYYKNFRDQIGKYGEETYFMPRLQLEEKQREQVKKEMKKALNYE